MEVPRQRNTREENETIKEGNTPLEWKKHENAHKRVQKDVDARWAKKNEEAFYGYKDHVKTDKKSKMITKYRVTDAAVHDSLELANLIEPDKDKKIYEDSAYVGEDVQSRIPQGIKNIIHEKGYCGRRF